ncbi:surface antigen BspA-like [Trichomonas vaginalis G3]|uniref:Surface antigen BspA-like n=1 Tax=Trichomonas vaginalis (strain ATCC PRA-98 / G3) TaxID=412133 RepID=A2E027_TRIV3|nr:leucine-rich repeats (6 copies)-containing protein [Trichomonas vaginalis G3]EAY13946.1 surface antigen BspA-like [Trichomonas vaginalis G3]KAI5551757.1 leucine-rich repeats (6 copies)-containing protein [Trichomonas vaginalis G3]|eukprot:XP_001326169.1 surface antigen BspA-like [Trichomonas vaginalis G3]
MDTISDYCFTSAYIFDLEIPNTITKIGNYAFSRAVFKPFSTQNLNRNLEFGTSTFAYTSIENFTLPSGISFVNPGLFSCCQYLKSIQIPHVDYIGKYAFFNCSSLEHVYINYGCKEIGEFAFSQSGINSITFPDSITKIGSNAFSHCINLKIFSVPKNLISVQYQTFVNCTNITSIDLHHVSSISSLAFYHCINLIKIIIPRNCKIVDSYAFSDCLSLCTVIICQKVTTNPFSFSNCTNLSLIIFKETSTIKNDTFTNCTSIQHIVLNQSVGFDEFPFDESLQNKIDLYYLSSTLRFSVNIGLYIHNVTALDTFMNPKFFGFTPTKVSNTTMNETIFSLDCAPEIDFSDDYVSNEDKITITAGIIPVKHKIHIDVNNGFVICKISLFNALSAVNIFLDLKKNNN